MWFRRLALLEVATVALLILSLTVESKKDRNVFHGHTGKLKPFVPGPFPNLQLSNDEIAKLDAGQAVMKQIMPDKPGEGGGSAICVQDVNAPLHAVWYQILDQDSYPKKVSKVNENKSYVIRKNPDNSITIKTKQVLGVLPGYSYESYYDHTYYPKHSSLTWTLDYEKTSDFDDVSGHWHVEEIAASRCRVFYAADIKMKGVVPGPILNYISKQALKQATAWVKKESEANPTATIPAIYGSGAGLPVFRGGANDDTKSATKSSTGFTSPFQAKGWGIGNLLPKRKL